MYTIRQAVPQDAQALLDYLMELAKEQGIPVLLTPERVRSFTLESEIELIQRYSTSDNSQFIVADADGEIIAAITLAGGDRDVNRHRVSLGISVAQGWRNQGIGTALMQYAIDWARENPVVHRLELEVFCHNERAIHVYKKLGFEIEGRRNRAFYKDGRFIDEYMMAILFD